MKLLQRVKSLVRLPFNWELCGHTDLTLCFPSARVTSMKDLRMSLWKTLDIGLIQFPLKSGELCWFCWKAGTADAAPAPSSAPGAERKGMELGALISVATWWNHFCISIFEFLFSSLGFSLVFILCHKQIWVWAGELRLQPVLTEPILCQTFLSHFLIRSWSKSRGHFSLIVLKNSLK